VCVPCHRAYNRETQRKWRLRNLEDYNKRASARQKAFRKLYPERAADKMLLHNYGVPIGTYAAMHTAQNGKCAICKTTKTPKGRRLDLDHCHETGKTRGLLCNDCNRGIGMFRHQIELLAAAIEYLRSHS
jgi:hypothetical protein